MLNLDKPSCYCRGSCTKPLAIYGKQHRPCSDCNLIWVYTVCSSMSVWMFKPLQHLICINDSTCAYVSARWTVTNFMPVVLWSLYMNGGNIKLACRIKTQTDTIMWQTSLLLLFRTSYFCTIQSSWKHTYGQSVPKQLYLLTAGL